MSEDGKLKCQSLSTVSENLQHDAAGAWSHMKSIFGHINRELEHIDTVHVQSDEPTTQYKNQSNFFLFYHYCKQFGFKKCTWNFTGAGHGKSKADGSEAVVKQQCDRLGARGNYIESVDNLVDLLQAADGKVLMIKVPDEYF